MYKDRKETTHIRVGEKHTLVYKEYKYNICQNGHKTNIQDIMYLKWREKKKNTSNPHYIPQCTLPLTKISYTNPPPTSMATLTSKTTSPCCHE